MLYCSLQLPLTALLGSIDGIKLHSLKYPPNVLALCWHNTPAYYAFYCANIIFDAGLVMKYYDGCSFIVKEGTNNKTWTESYSPAQEELENHCFIAVDVSYEHLFTSCQSDCM